MQAASVKGLVTALVTMAAASALTLAPRAASAQAENYQPIQVGLGAGVAMATGIDAYGPSASLEVKYNVHDRVAVGARFDGAAMLGGGLGEGSNVSVGQRAAASFLAKGDYYFTDAPVRPFVGLGVGLFYFGGQDFSSSSSSANIDQKAGRYFGVAPQVGIELGAFRLAATYNALLGADVEVTQSVGTGEQTADISQNYFTFELGVRIGGKHRPAGSGQLTTAQR